MLAGMDIKERIGSMRRVNDLSARQLAALAGVAPSTITRIESGAIQPSFDLAAELLAILGEPLTELLTANADSILAARRALDPSFPVETTAGSEQWIERWARIGLVDDDGRVASGREADLLFRAATVARLPRRAGRVDFLPSGDWVDVAGLLADSNLEWALTGDSAANFYLPSASDAWPVFYVADLAAAAECASLVRRPTGVFGRCITFIPFDGICEVGRTENDGLWVAARAQVVLDCYGGIGRMREQADFIMGARI
jgi:transcriptional regulator with XRE-family HTH domain